jgi:hypothetical protein
MTDITDDELADDPCPDFDDYDCGNCGGEGFVYGCEWDWQCDTYDEGEGTCSCTRPCDWCNPPKPTHESEALWQLLADAFIALPTESNSHD